MLYKIAAIFFLILGVNNLSSTAEPEEDSLKEIFEIGSVQSLQVEKGGEMLFEEYLGSMNGSRNVNIKSASKSVLSLLVGIAIDEGYLEGTDQTIDTFFPDYFEANPNPEKEAITIKDLLTMRSGLETTSFQNYGRWVVSNNWIWFTLNQPMEEERGGRMVYSTGTSHLLSVIITRASGMSTRAFANRYLFGPMDIRVGGWDRDPQGYYMGGNNMALSPNDLLKIGRMMMDLGEYNGEQIVSAEWILDSVKKYTRSNFNPYDYGYMWWRRSVGNYEAVFAWGHGGQYILMFPELDTAVSITSDLTRNQGSRGYQRRIFEFLEEELIPVIEKS